MFAKGESLVTVGAELENHSIFIFKIKYSNNTDAETDTVQQERLGQQVLFRAKGIVCTADGHIEGYRKVIKSLSEQPFRLQKDEVLVKVNFSETNGSRLFGILEFSTDPVEHFQDYQEQIRKIKIMEQHLTAFIEDVYADVELIAISDWVVAFNEKYKNQPELQISIPQEAEDVYFIVRYSKQQMAAYRDGEYPHYPQFNLSASIDSLLDTPLEDLLAEQLDESMRILCKPRIESAEEEVRMVHNLIKIAQEKRDKYQEEFLTQTLLPLKETNVTNAQDAIKNLKKQRVILEISRRNASQGIIFLNNSLADLPQHKFKKLGGFLFLLNVFVLTNTERFTLYSTSKNAYLFFIKNKVTDIFKECLSDRDRKILEELAPDKRRAFLESIVGKELLGKKMFDIDETPVSVEDFLMSACNWPVKLEQELRCKLCDQIPNPGLLSPPREVEGVHSKATMGKIVLEFRWPGEYLSLDEAEVYMQEVIETSERLSQTTRTQRFLASKSELSHEKADALVRSPNRERWARFTDGLLAQGVVPRTHPHQSPFALLLEHGSKPPDKVQKPVNYFPFDRYPQLSALKKINPTYKFDLFFEAHHQVYEFLVLGKQPANVHRIAKKDLRSEVINEQLYTEYAHDKRWGVIQNILSSAENGSVYAVETRDHAYNLIKLDDKLFLIDPSFGIYKEITKPEDFVYTEEDLPKGFPEEQDYLLDGVNVLTSLEHFAIAAVGVIKSELVPSQQAVDKDKRHDDAAAPDFVI